jgi:hypothetical protein
MGVFGVFIIRLILAVVFAALISRVFFQGMSSVKISMLAVVLFGLAYLLEYFRKRDKGGGHGD